MKKRRGVTSTNNLSVCFPSVAAEWDYSKNEGHPKHYPRFPRDKVWWKCSKGHEWSSRIRDRTFKNQNCPFCSHKRPSKNYNLHENFPEIAQQWNGSKNTKIPQNYMPHSNKKVWWKCERGHEWKANINNRTSNNVGCPYCCNKKVCKENSLAITNSDLLDEWDWEKNSISPSAVTPGSGRKVWWKCKYSHQWEATIYNRTKFNGTNCPSCCLNQTSKIEKRIFAELKWIFPLAEWRYQIDGYECDVFLLEIGLGLEIDGAYWHENKREQDIEKNLHFHEREVPILRIREFPLDKISDHDIIFGGRETQITVVGRLLKALLPIIKDESQKKLLGRFTGFRNHELYRKLLKTSVKLNQTAYDENPILAKFWDFEKNSPLTLKDFPRKSHYKAWWKCSNGHSWQAPISNRTGSKYGCPKCRKTVIQKKTVENNRKMLHND